MIIICTKKSIQKERSTGTRIENIQRKKEKSVYLGHYVKDSIAYKKLGGLLSFIIYT